MERGEHVEGEKEHRVQKERSIERVEEGEVPSTSGTARSPRSAERRPHTEPRTVSPGGQKRHYNNREQYSNRKDVHKDQWHASHNRDHYHHHSSSSHHRYVVPSELLFLFPLPLLNPVFLLLALQHSLVIHLGSLRTLLCMFVAFEFRVLQAALLYVLLSQMTVLG